MFSAPLRQGVQEFGFGLFLLAEEEVCCEHQSSGEIQQFADCSNAMRVVGGEWQGYHQSINIIPQHLITFEQDAGEEDAGSGFHRGALPC
jgi:hypothetical protein